jgi:hypothetical protein
MSRTAGAYWPRNGPTDPDFDELDQRTVELHGRLSRGGWRRVSAASHDLSRPAAPTTASHRRGGKPFATYAG